MLQTSAKKINFTELGKFFAYVIYGYQKNYETEYRPLWESIFNDVCWWDLIIDFYTKFSVC